MGAERQDPKAAPMTGMTEPGLGPKVGAASAGAPGKAPPLPPRAANGGSGVSPVAPVVPPAPGLPQMAVPPPAPFQPSPSVRPGSSENIETSSSIPIPIETDVEPPVIDDGLEADTADTDAPPALDPLDPTPVDFDALHAALGEGSREAAAPVPVPAPPPPQVKVARAHAAESQGRSSATYASARAQAPPAAHIDTALGAPAVIVATDDTVPAAPPHMTTPMGAMGGPHPSSGPHHSATPISGGMAAAIPPAHAPGNTPQAFNPLALGLPPRTPGQVALTMRMPERPRRPRTPTVVVRSRGPSTKQKLAVFSVMLLLVSMIGLGIVVWRAPQLFGLGPKTTPTAPPKATISLTPATTTAQPTASAVPSTSVSTSATTSAAPSASASASAKTTLPFLKPKGR